MTLTLGYWLNRSLQTNKQKINRMEIIRLLDVIYKNHSKLLLLEDKSTHQTDSTSKGKMNL